MAPIKAPVGVMRRNAGSKAPIACDAAVVNNVARVGLSKGVPPQGTAGAWAFYAKEKARRRA